MKILQVIYSLSSGGDSRVAADLANELAHKGHDVTMCILYAPNERHLFNKSLLSDNVKFLNLNLETKNIENARLTLKAKLKAPFVFRNLLKKEKYDIVHCHMTTLRYLYFEALFNRKIKVVYTLHNVAEHTGCFPIEKPVHKWFFRTKRIWPITISEICYQSFLKYYNCDAVSKINNGRTPLEKTEKFEEVKNELALYNKDNAPVFIHIARFSPQKNQGLLIQSFNELAKEGYDYTLIIIGATEEEFSVFELTPEARPKIHILGLKSNIADYLLNADAFCLTSHFEGLPISLLEAMSCGCIPISTKAGGTVDVILDGKTGYLTEISLESYKKALIHYLTNNTISKETVIAHFESNFTMNICADAHLDLYKK